MTAGQHGESFAPHNWQNTSNVFQPAEKPIKMLMQAGRIIAQLLVSGGMIVFRAAAQAYQQALASARHTPERQHLPAKSLHVCGKLMRKTRVHALFLNHLRSCIVDAAFTGTC